MTQFFTSDTHLGHANIIKYCNRPFANVDEMNREIVRRWNSVVKPEDEVYHLGDFAFFDAWSFLEELNGDKSLVAGNHDRSQTRKLDRWVYVYTGRTFLPKADGTILACLSHKPPPSSFGKDIWHLHGHKHSTPETCVQGNYIDVGVDAWDFTPRTWEELMERANAS